MTIKIVDTGVEQSETLASRAREAKTQRDFPHKVDKTDAMAPAVARNYAADTVLVSGSLSFPPRLPRFKAERATRT